MRHSNINGEKKWVDRSTLYGTMVWWGIAGPTWPTGGIERAPVWIGIRVCLSSAFQMILSNSISYKSKDPKKCTC